KRSRPSQPSAAGCADFPGPNAVGVGRARRLKLRPLFGTLCEELVIIRDLKHHLLGYFVLHIIGKTARFVGAFAPVLRVVNKGGRHKVTLKRPPHDGEASTSMLTAWCWPEVTGSRPWLNWFHSAARCGPSGRGGYARLGQFYQTSSRNA